MLQLKVISILGTGKNNFFQAPPSEPIGPFGFYIELTTIYIKGRIVTTPPLRINSINNANI